MKTNTCHSPTGFTLIEVLATVVVLAVFLLLSTRLFVGCIRLTGTTAGAEASVVRLDSSVDQLRRDVWHARTAVVDGTTLRIVPAAGADILWRIDSAAAKVTLRRGAKPAAGPAEERSWPNLPGPMRFEVRGSAVVLTAPDADGKPASLVLVSQWILAGGRP